MNVFLDVGAFLPTKAHHEDAGWDLRAREGAVIKAGGSYCFDTGVHVELPRGTVMFLKSKSGLNVKHGILSDGVIDEGYTGSIVVKLYNHGDHDVVIEEGDKITQAVILPVVDVDINRVDSLNEFVKTSRGDDGFGSSGR